MPLSFGFPYQELMMRSGRSSTLNPRAALLVAWIAMLGCREVPTAPPASVGTRLSHRTDRDASAAPLVIHLIPPATTDPAIDQFLDNHYVSLDTSAQSVHRLLVLMPGTGQRPSQFQLVQEAAARQGYHVIGLEYVNSGGLAKICPRTADPAACYEDVRLEVIDGVDRTPLITVTQPNSIDNRLDKLLRYLDARYPDEGWSQFLDANGPKWPLICVAGLSVGGGEAAMIAKIRLVDRVLLFSSVPDSIGQQSAPWLSQHRTPSNRYYGLAHNRDGFFVPIIASWDSLGLAAFGSQVLVDEAQPPFGHSHMLETGRTPVGGFIGLNAHSSTVTDALTPLDVDGTPLLLDAWRYMLSRDADSEDSANRANHPSGSRIRQ